MKHRLLLAALLFTGLSASAQLTLNNVITPLEMPVPSIHNVASGPVAKTTTCANDTVFYPLAKATTASLYTLVGNGGGAFGEGAAQWYPAPGPVTIHGFVFHGRAKHDDVIVNARLYSATADSLPLVQLATVQVTLDSTGAVLSDMMRTAIFSTPVTVTTPYLVVVEGQLFNTDTFNLVFNGTGNGAGEHLSKIRTLGTVWIDSDGAYSTNADFLAYPITHYDLTASFTSTSACAGDEVDFTNTSSGIIESRFYNQAAFFNMTETSYTWDFGDGSETENSVNPSHEFTAGGNYVVMLTDTLFGWTMNCSADTSVLVEAIELALTADVTQVSCNGEENGEIDLTVENGDPAYVYEWSNGAVTQDISGLDADDYTVIVTDINGCDDTLTTTVTEPDELIVSGDVSPQTAGGDASIDVDVEGGSGNYFYQWSNGENTEDIEDLEEGVYTVVVTDSAGCQDSATFIVESLGLADATGNALNLYPNPAKGSVNLTMTGYTGETIAVAVLDVTGKAVRQSVIQNDAGTLVYSIDLAELAPGNYTVRLGSENVQHTQQLILLK